MEKRVINIRFLFCIFVSLMLGIILSRFFLIDNGNWIYVLIISLLFVMLAGLGYFYSYFTKEYNKQCRQRLKISYILKCSTVGSVVAFFVGIIITLFPLYKIFTLPTYTNDVVVKGEIVDYVKGSDISKSFLIDDVLIVCNNNSYNCDYKVRVYTSPNVDIEVGDSITFVSTLEKYSYSDSNDLSSLVDGVGYSAYANIDELIIDDGDLGLRESIKTNIKDILDKNLSQDNANISYALLFGGSKTVSNEIKDMFSYAGISHILAVSGLHVGVIFAFIWKILGLIKKPRHRKKREYPKLIVFSILMLFYMYLCGFSVSVCRAGIMMFLYALCNCLLIEYDSLSSLSLAGIVILLINPMALFNLSFQLSFLCIFSIISLAPTLERLFKKIKMPKFLAGAFAVSISTNVAILPVCLNAFTQVSLLGVLANLFVLPIFEILYVLLFIIIVISLLIPIIGTLLCIPNAFLHLIKVVVNYVNQIPIGVFRAFNVGFLVLLFLSLLILFIHFLLVKIKLKAFIVSFLSLFLIVIMVYFYMPINYSSHNLFIHQQTKSNVVFVINNNNVTMIGSDVSKTDCDYMCKKMKIKQIDNIIAYDMQLNELANLQDIVLENKVKNIYIPNLFDYNVIKDKFNNIRVFDTEISVGGTKYYFYSYLNKIIGTQFYLNGVGNILIPAIDNVKDSNIYLSNECYNFDYLLLTKSNSVLESKGSLSDIIYFGNQDMVRLEG